MFCVFVVFLLAVELELSKVSHKPEIFCRSWKNMWSPSSRSTFATLGTNSYYYAHTRSYEVPEDAKVVSGPSSAALCCLSELGERQCPRFWTSAKVRSCICTSRLGPPWRDWYGVWATAPTQR